MRQQFWSELGPDCRVHEFNGLLVVSFKVWRAYTASIRMDDKGLRGLGQFLYGTNLFDTRAKACQRADWITWTLVALARCGAVTLADVTGSQRYLIGEFACEAIDTTARCKLAQAFFKNENGPHFQQLKEQIDRLAQRGEDPFF